MKKLYPIEVKIEEVKQGVIFAKKSDINPKPLSPLRSKGR